MTRNPSKSASKDHQSQMTTLAQVTTRQNEPTAQPNLTQEPLLSPEIRDQTLLHTKIKSAAPHQGSTTTEESSAMTERRSRLPPAGLTNLTIMSDQATTHRNEVKVPLNLTQKQLCSRDLQVDPKHLPMLIKLAALPQVHTMRVTNSVTMPSHSKLQKSANSDLTTTLALVTTNQSDPKV
jgi:hypothetical protein